MTTNFWSNASLEPKRSYRWVLYMGGIPTWLIKSCKKPEAEIGEIEANYLNHYFFYPGRVKWNPTDVTLLDPITPDASRTMMNILKAAGYHYPTDPNDLTTVSKKNAVAALGNVKVVQIDPDGKEVESWTFINAWVKNVKWGELSYTEDKMVEITLTIRFDYPVIDTTDPGIAAASD